MFFVHPITKARLDRLLIDLPQSILLTGPKGIGLSAAVAYLCRELKIDPYIVHPRKDTKLDTQKGSVSVEDIRELYDLTRTKLDVKRLVVIDQADTMSRGAQNAFLKLLEEPNLATHFVLLSHNKENLLPTILSRVQMLELRPIDRATNDVVLDGLKVNDATKRSQLLFIAEGYPAELIRLASDDDYFEARSQIIRDARDFLQGSTYAQLKIVDAYKDNREKALILLSDSAKLLKRNLVSDASPQIISRLNRLLDSYDKLEANGNIRLRLAELVV